VAQNEQNGWNEYSRLVLQELERLSDNINDLKGDLQEVRQELVTLQAKEDKVEELRAWKEKIDDVASPTQLKELVNEVDSLRTFKTKAVTAFIVIQFLMATYAWVLKTW
jgi:predicted nuclease with TOPRIM domain